VGQKTGATLLYSFELQKYCSDLHDFFAEIKVVSFLTRKRILPKLYYVQQWRHPISNDARQ